MNDGPYLADLFDMFGVEVESINHDSLEEVEDSDPTIWFNYYDVDSRMTNREVDNWVVQFQTLNRLIITYLTWASTMCHTLTLQSYPAEMA